MKDHALIGKFVGIWTSWKALTWWINGMWNPKGNYDLQLGIKGFLIILFFNLEEHNMEGPYFLNSTGLFLKEWKERFNLDREYLTVAPIWIHLCSWPMEY